MIYRGFYWCEDDRDLGMTGSGVCIYARDPVLSTYKRVGTITHRALAAKGISTVFKCAKVY